jgi:predicted double-glycine peptidase
VEDGSVGHFIVITGVENNSVVFNDPGFPPLENKKMEFEEFKKYWDIPDIKGRNLIAIKLGCYKGTMSIY